MKKYLSCLIFLGWVSIYAQPSIEWKNSFGGSGDDDAYNIIQLENDGYITVGSTNSNDANVQGNHGSYDIVVIKFSESGDIEWHKCYGGSGVDRVRKMVKTNDGGYAIIGSTFSNDGDVTINYGHSDYWVIKITASGDIEWQKSFGGTNFDSGSSIQQTLDGGYIVTGSSSSNDGHVTNNHGSADYWVLKLNATGNIEWQKTYGGSNGELSNDVKQTADGGFIVIGQARANSGDVTGNHGVDDYWVVKLGATGNIEWQKSFGGTDEETACEVIQDSDGNYLIAGFTESNDGDITGSHGSMDAWVVKIDGLGSIIWQKTLGGSDSDYLFSIQQTSDDGYVLAGDSFSIDGDVTGHHPGLSLDYWVVKLSNMGQLQWHKTMGGSSDDTAISCLENSQGEYIVTGRAYSNDLDITTNYGESDCWIVKLNENLSVKDSDITPSIALYPNPANEYLSIAMTSTSGNTYKIYDQLGRVVLGGKLGSDKITIKDLSEGVYIFKLDDSKLQSKFVKRHN